MNRRRGLVGLATNLSPASVTGPCPWHMPPASGMRCLCSSSSLLDSVIIIIVLLVVIFITIIIILVVVVIIIISSSSALDGIMHPLL